MPVGQRSEEATGRYRGEFHGVQFPHLDLVRSMATILVGEFAAAAAQQPVDLLP